MKIANRLIGKGQPTYVIAELSANHHHNLENALKCVEAAKEAGADAIKIQTYTADTMTLSEVGAGQSKYFQIKGGTPWDGKNLHQLYQEAYTPWEWHLPIQQAAQKNGLDFFSTAFDFSSVDFLESLSVPAYKIASFEILDLPLIAKIAATQKPIILSTGMASVAEIRDAVETVRAQKNSQLTLLRCTSAYPALYDDMHLRTIPDLAQQFGCPVGLSDHTLGISVPIAAVALGASVIEKHFTLDRSVKGPDSAFSLEPHEFKAMVKAVREAEAALGRIAYGAKGEEKKSLRFRRTLWVAKSMRKGELFTTENLRSVRPGDGLAGKYLNDFLGSAAACDIEAGTPLSWDLLQKAKAA